jgi:hypothetical protein
MTEGYAIWRSTLGPRGCQNAGIDPLRPAGRGLRVSVEEVSICIALDDVDACPLRDEIARDLDIATAESVGAINLSPLRWGAKWPEGRWLLDGGTDRTEGHS